MAERRVWIAQCLCPQRHCILAVTCEAETLGEAEASKALLDTTITTLIHDGTLNPWCALCRAPATDWTIDVNRTRFATQAEAEPALRKIQAEQLIANAIFGDIPRND